MKRSIHLLLVLLIGLVSACGVDSLADTVENEARDATTTEDQVTSTDAPTTEATTTTTKAPRTTTTTKAPRTTTTTEAPTYDHDLITQTFLDLMRDRSPFLASQTDDDLIGAAWATCDLFDAGGDAYDVLSVVLEQDPAHQEDLAFLSGAGTAAFCPEHNYQWDGF